MFAQLAGNCTAAAIPLPTVVGAEFLSVQASLVQNYSVFVPAIANKNHGDIKGSNMSFCNVTLTHTHPGASDTLTTQIWLPLKPAWNERLQAAGGAGWIAGLDADAAMEMAGAIAEGYAAMTTNGGVPPTNNPEAWALLSPGNVDLIRLQDFASVAYNDATLAAKSVISSFYGQPAKYSYWSGCSQGGRQGYMVAQRYPNLFDGIAAAAPGINWAQFFIADYFPQQVMNEMGTYPHPCEFQALSAAAIKACDGDDGLVDGLISNPDACNFDPSSLIGTTTVCNSSATPVTISSAAATVADASWNGPRKADGSFLWYGNGYEAPLAAPSGLAMTICADNGTCIGQSWPLWPAWIQLFVKKDPTFNVAGMSREEYSSVFAASVREYDSIMGTSYPDMSEFRKAGGKLITYQGLADTAISYRGTRHYYDAVRALDNDVHDFYRLFESPGLTHCYGGAGGYPAGTFDALVKWVEEGVAPDQLEAKLLSTNQTTILCPYPKRAHFSASSSAMCE